MDLKELIIMRATELQNYAINYTLEMAALLIVMIWFVVCLNICYRSAMEDEEMNRFAFFIFFMGMFFLFPVYFVFDIILGMNLSGVDD